MRLSDLRNAEAKARDKWLESEEGVKCQSGQPQGQYLRNRLERAFLAGYAAAKEAEHAAE